MATAIEQSAGAARSAGLKLAAMTAKAKNSALIQIRDSLKANAEKIISANQADIAHARQENLAESLLKRLKFDSKKLQDVCDGIDSLINLDDPVGKTLDATELDDGLELYKVSCPLGVIGIIFESRPDALVQISTLCLKSGNAVLLKGGSEAINTNKILAEIILQASVDAGMPAGWIQLLETRQDVAEMLKLDKYVDLIIPRGSNEFVRHIMDNTNIAVLGHADGICHVYVHSDAQIDMAVKIAVDSKTQYVAVCNAAETLLVHKDIAGKFLPAVAKVLSEKGVELRGCKKTRKIIKAAAAGETDWRTEYLDSIISIRVVDSLDEAIDHINEYGSHHTDAIVCTDSKAAAKFMEMVDSADVFWNASTRFSDGYRFGLGAEVGISTNKIHARGPVGLEGLVIYKWKLIGSGQTVAEYADGRKKFKHKKLNKTFNI